MKKIDLALYIILAAIIIIGIYTIYSLVGDSPQANFQTLTSNENDVEFQVTPFNPSEFEISINTHSVDLNFDLTEISTLYDDIGNSYKPLKWGGSEPGGHHRSGILKFSSINKNAKSIKLVIDDGAERVFNWNI